MASKRSAKWNCLNFEPSEIGATGWGVSIEKIESPKNGSNAVFRLLNGVTTDYQEIDIPKAGALDEICSKWAIEHGLVEKDIKAAILEQYEFASEWVMDQMAEADKPKPRTVTGEASARDTKDDVEPHFDNGLPAIKTNGEYIRDIADASLKAIHAKNDPPTLFNMGKIIVRLDRSGVETERVDAVILRHILERCANYVTKNDNGLWPSRVPNDLPGDLLSQKENGLPELRVISPIPIFLPDGQLLSTNGYDEKSGTYLCMNSLDGVRSDMPISEARAWIEDELLVDFPFAGDASKAHALAMLIESFVRPIINGPRIMYVLDAPGKGSGKTLLARLLAVIITGCDAQMMVLPQREEEIEKRITSILLSSVPIAILDNTKKIDSESIASLITSTIWKGRELGKSKMLLLPNNTLWVATGNNIDLSDEAVRRVASIRLDSGMENPEDRTDFKHTPLFNWAMEERVSLISALLSLVHRWIDAGMPPGKETVGGFENWARVIGGVLAHAEIEGFMQDRAALRAEADQVTQEWRSVCHLWSTIHGNRSIAASTLFSDVIRPNRLLMNLWADKTDLQAAQNIARALRRNRGRVFGDWVISMGEIDQHTKNGTYRLDAKPPQTPREHRTDTATEKPKESKTYDEPISEHRTDTATEKPKESKTYDDPAVSAVLLRGLKDMCPKCGCGRISWGVDHGRCLNSNCGIKILPSGSGGTHTA